MMTPMCHLRSSETAQLLFYQLSVLNCSFPLTVAAFPCSDEQEQDVKALFGQRQPLVNGACRWEGAFHSIAVGVLAGIAAFEQLLRALD